MDLGQQRLGLPQQGQQQQGQQPAAAGQNDQLAQMINKLLGMWSAQQKQQQQQQTSQQQQQPQPAQQQAPARNGWTPYRVPIPDHLQQYFQGAQNG